MSPLIAASPILALIGLMLFSPLSAVWSAAVTLLVALIITLTLGQVGAFSLTVALIPQIAVLFLTVATVIIPGLLFVNVTSQSGAADELKNWVARWPINDGSKIIVIVVGVATAVESMTGFGVSMVITIPLLLNMLRRDRALMVGLLGMSIMPWGTLGLATIIGATIANVTPTTLGYHSAVISSLVFPIAAMTGCIVAGYQKVQTLMLAVAVGIFFSIFLIVTNYLVGPSIAGVLSGLAVIVVMLSTAHVRHQHLPTPGIAIAPYAFLITFVILERILWLTVPGIQHIGVSAGRFSWSLFESPGLPLLLTSFLTRYSFKQFWQSTCKAIKPLLSITLLLVMSQVMVLGGQMKTIADALKPVSDMGGEALFAFFSALSGYVTGSNVGANALLMPTATLLDRAEDTVYAAVQNSAAGHAVLASIPIVILLLSIAGNQTKEEESWLLRRGALIAVINTISIGALASLLI
jgi:lactate permease